MDKSCSPNGSDDILENVIEEGNEEGSSRNLTPSAINPMEVSNYQDELNNFILSRGNQGLPCNSGLTSANDSNSQAHKGGGSSMINTNRFQYVANKFESGGDTPNGVGFVVSSKKGFANCKDDDEEAFLFDSLNSQSQTPDGVKTASLLGEVGNELPLQSQAKQPQQMMSSEMMHQALHQAALNFA